MRTAGVLLGIMWAVTSWLPGVDAHTPPPPGAEYREYALYPHCSAGDATCALNPHPLTSSSCGQFAENSLGRSDGRLLTAAMGGSGRMGDGGAACDRLGQAAVMAFPAGLVGAVAHVFLRSALPGTFAPGSYLEGSLSIHDAPGAWVRELARGQSAPATAAEATTSDSFEVTFPLQPVLDHGDDLAVPIDSPIWWTVDVHTSSGNRGLTVAMSEREPTRLEIGVIGAPAQFAIGGNRGRSGHFLHTNIQPWLGRASLASWNLTADPDSGLDSSVILPVRAESQTDAFVNVTWRLEFNPTHAQPGMHNFTLAVTDVMGQVTTKAIAYQYQGVFHPSATPGPSSFVAVAALALLTRLRR